MPKLEPQARVRALEERLGVPLPRADLALCALTHKSYTNEHRGEVPDDNERLEFLGDAVIDLAISHRLMERHPAAREGELSKLRALIVNEEGLAKVARALGLGELLLLGKGEELTGGREKSSVLADALEAVIGALYLAHGMEVLLTFVDRCFGEALEAVANGTAGADYKTLLQEEAQVRHKLAPRYRVLSEHGPEHAKIFEVEVSLGEVGRACARGRSKKEAEQAAARQLLALVRTNDLAPESA
jgi:ribonuclease III